MGKSEIMALGTLIKFALGLTGIFMTFFYLITGLKRKDNGLLKKAGLVFIGMWVSLILFTAIEFWILGRY